MTTTAETTPAPILTNSFGIPCTYQNLAYWNAYVLTCNSGGALDRAWKDLREGNGGHSHIHPFADRSPDFEAARKAIWKRAFRLKLTYSRVSYRFVETVTAPAS